MSVADDQVPLPEPLLKVSEVAALLRVSPMTVYRMVETKELVGSRVGRSVRIPRSAVRELLGDACPEGL